MQPADAALERRRLVVDGDDDVDLGGGRGRAARGGRGRGGAGRTCQSFGGGRGSRVRRAWESPESRARPPPGAHDPWPPSSSTTTPPWGSQPAAASGPLSTCRLRAHLGLERRRRQRGRLDDAGERGPAGGGVEQVVRGAAARVEPAAAADPARRHAAGGDAERVQDGVGERARHARPAGPVAGQPQVAGARDDDAGPAREPLGDQVGEQALGEPAAVERHAGRPLHDAAARSARDAAPARVAAPGRRARGGGASRSASAERQRRARRACGSPPRRSRARACRRPGRRSRSPAAATASASASSSGPTGPRRAGRR